MSTLVLTDARIWFDSWDLSGDANAVALSDAAEPKDATTFGVGTRVRKGGLQAVDCQVKGIAGLGSTTADQDYQTFTRLGNLGAPFSLAPAGLAVGNPAYTFQTTFFKYGLDAPLGELVGFTIEASAVKGSNGARPALARGNVLLSASKSATGSESVVQMGAIASGRSLYAAMHLFSYAGGGSLTMRIQSAATFAFTSPTTRATFAVASGIGSAVITPVAGAITDQYWRADWTFSGTSFLAAVVAGIR